MGLSGISPWSLLLILMIAVMIFGTQRIRHIGRDLSGIVKDFRQGLNEAEKTDKDQSA